MESLIRDLACGRFPRMVADRLLTDFDDADAVRGLSYVGG